MTYMYKASAIAHFAQKSLFHCSEGNFWKFVKYGSNKKKSGNMLSMVLKECSCSTDRRATR